MLLLFEFETVDDTAWREGMDSIGTDVRGRERRVDFAYPKGHPIRSNDWRADLAIG